MRWLALVLLWALPCAAANKFVRDGATGDGSGSDWTNACDDFTYGSGSCDENNLTRGDTYYVADGTYSSAQFDTATSGTSTITIKKCSTTDGVSSGISGYSSTYCDGQAVFGDITVGVTTGGSASNYWIFDGAYRNESDWSAGSAYGFKFGSVWSGGSGITCSANVTVQYAEITPGDTSSRPVFLRFGSCNNWTFSRNYIHDGGEVNFAGVENLTWEYNYQWQTYGKECIRGQVTASDLVIRHNTFHDCCRDDFAPGEGCTAEVGVFANVGDTPDFEGFRAYGNIVWKALDQHKSDASIFAQAGDCLIYNNTVYDDAASGVSDLECTGGGSSESRNNVVYLPNGMTAGFTATTSNNNSTYTSSPPFVNVTTGDFHLTGAVAGASLAAAYNLDRDGVTRGADGTWDRGAYEYDEGGGLEAPTNFRLLSLSGLIAAGLAALLGGGLAMRLMLRSPVWR